MAAAVFLATAWLGISAPAARANAELVMVEAAGCTYCLRWLEEVGGEYPITPEGRAAPLRRIDISDPVPDDLTLERRAVFTPTFILVEDGVEVGRLEGYPGEDFFWGLLGRMLESAGIEYSAATN